MTLDTGSNSSSDEDYLYNITNTKHNNKVNVTVGDAKFQIARVQAQGKNSGPASKARYFVLSAFAHERSILIGCLLLDSIIRSVILSISLKFENWSLFSIKNGTRTDCLLFT